MLNLPRPHGYGSAQVVEAWQKKLQRKGTERKEKATQDFRMKQLTNNANVAADNKMFKLLDIMYKGVESGNDALADMAENQLNELAKTRNSTINYSKIHDKAEAIQAQKTELTTGIKADIANATTLEGLALARNRMIGSKRAFKKEEFDLIKYAYNKKEKELQPKTLTELKADVFKGLTPEQQKQTVMKPSVEIKMEQISKQTETKEKAYLKTGRFRANVQKDVRALNKDMWSRWTKAQRTDAIRTETDKRVRQSYSKAKYGELNGRKGWYIKDMNGNDILIAPWNE